MKEFSHRAAASGMLGELSGLQRVGRASRKEVWFPLLAFGAVNLAAAPVVLLVGREHLGPFILPSMTLAGVASAMHGRARGRKIGAQSPVWPWIVVTLIAGFIAAMCSVVGREIGSRELNLAGPGLAIVAGLSVLALWAQSTALVALVTCMAVITVAAIGVLDGDSAIALQLAAWGVLMTACGRFLARQKRSSR